MKIYQKILFLAIAVLLTACNLFKSSKLEIDISLIPVESGDKWGYINKEGKYIINPQFSDASFFRDGLAKVISMDGKIGYINTKGNYVIPAKYKDGTHFYEGFAFVVADGENITCIDKKGNTKFVLKNIDYAEPFSAGLALVGVKGQGWGFIDTKGEFVINPQFESAKPFREGLAAVCQNDKWGFIDKTGKIIINPQFEHVSSFYDSKALFYDGTQWGFINKKGEYDINPQFESAAIFSEGLSAIQQGNQGGYINEKGQIVINPQFDYAGDFNSGLSVIKQNNKAGYINKKGQIVINPQFYYASQFFGDIAFVMDAEARWGIIDKKGKYLVNPQFDYMKFKIANIEEQWVQTDYRNMEDELRERAAELCQYIPDHQLLKQSKYFLTADFYAVLDTMFNYLPKVIDHDGWAFDHEWLYYFVTGNGGELPDYEVTGVEQIDDTHAVATIRVRLKYEDKDGSFVFLSDDFIDEHKLSMEKVDGQWLMSDFDGHKADCIRGIAISKEQYAICWE